MLNISNIQDPPDLSIIRGYPCTMSAKIGFFPQRICAMVPLEYHWLWWCYMLILKRPHSEIPEKSPKPNLRRFCDSAWSPVFIFMQLPSHFSTYEDLTSFMAIVAKIRKSGYYQIRCSPTKSGLSSIPLSWRILRCSITRPTWAVVSPLEKSFTILAFDCYSPLTIKDVRLFGHCFWHFAPLMSDDRIILSSSH